MSFAQDFLTVDKKLHDLKAFDCGKPEMNEFLARYAVKNMGHGLSTTWVLPIIEDGGDTEKAKIAAYYTLAISTVKREEIPTDTSLPRYPIPAVLLARLAVDQQFKRQKLGEKTLVTALKNAVDLTDRGLGAFCVVLDVLDDEALNFYQSFDTFEPFNTDPMKLFVSMNVLKKL